MVPAGAASLGVLGVGLSVVVGATARPLEGERDLQQQPRGGRHAAGYVFDCAVQQLRHGHLACAVAGLLAALITAAAGCANAAWQCRGGRASSGGASAISSCRQPQQPQPQPQPPLGTSSSPPHHTSSRRAAGEGSEFLDLGS